MAKIDDLPPDLWPTWRWLHTWILRQGLKTDEFVQASGINPHTFKKIRGAPSRPLPFTDQWKRVVADRDKIAEAIRGTVGVSPDDVSSVLRSSGVTVNYVLGKVGLPRSTFARWAKIGRVPDTPQGKLFVKTAHAIIEGQPESARAPGQSPARKGRIARRIPDVSPGDVENLLKTSGLSTARAATEAAVSPAIITSWRKAGYVPDTKKARAFLAVVAKSLLAAGIEPPEAWGAGPPPAPPVGKLPVTEAVIERLRQLEIPLARVAREAGLSKTQFYNWRRAGRIPDNEAGYAFLKTAEKYLGEIK